MVVVVFAPTKDQQSGAFGLGDPRGIAEQVFSVDVDADELLGARKLDRGRNRKRPVAG